MPEPFQPKFVDLVRNFTTTQGTGNFVLGAAVAGHTSLASAVATGERFYYCAMGVDKPTEREVGRGTKLANGTIAREPISGPLTNFSNGTKTISLVVAAGWFDEVGTWINGGAEDLSALITTDKTCLVAAVNEIAGSSSSGGSGGGLDLTFAAASVAPIGATVMGVETNGHSTAGTGAARYVYDAAVNAAFVAAHPSWSFLAANGRGFRLCADVLQLEYFGAIPGDFATGVSADCIPAWNAAMDYLDHYPRNVAIAAYEGTREILFPGHQYFFSDTLQLKRALRLRGMGCGAPGGISTMLRFAADKAGIVVNRYNTLGDAEASPTTTGGDGSIIEGFYLFGGGGAPNLLKSGVRMRARATVRDCLIGNFAGAGVCISADTSVAASDPYHGNANNWRIDMVRCQVNKYGGVYVSGGDANAGVAILVDASQNGRFGIRDSAFLGNTWVGCHADGNGLHNIAGVAETSIVSHGGIRYYLANGQDANGATTTPGTDPTVWVSMGAGGVHANVPAWSALLSYVSGGAYLHTGAANVSPFTGCYCEGGQAPPQMLGAAIVTGGFMGNGLATGAPHLTGSTGNGLQSQRPFTQRHTFADASTATHALGGDMSGTALDLLTWNSSVATPSNPAAKGRFYQDKTTGDLIWDAYAVLNPVRFTGFSTARTYGGRSQAESRYIFEVRNIALGVDNNARVMTMGSAAPTTGFHGLGEIVWNDGTLTAIATVGHWRCTVAGTPGTWVAVGPLSTGASIGYAAGAGGTATQTGGKNQPVTLNKATGRITMHAASMAAGEIVNFSLTNTFISGAEVLVVNIMGGATLNSYSVDVAQVTAGGARIQVQNISGGALAEAIQLNFAILKMSIS